MYVSRVCIRVRGSYLVFFLGVAVGDRGGGRGEARGERGGERREEDRARDATRFGVNHEFVCLVFRA